MKLLICDDDISTVDVIEKYFNYQEYGITQILRAYNGEVAAEVIKKEEPELVFCDIGMPKKSGLEVLKDIRESGSDCEFTFLTCYESFEFAKEAIRYGASNYLSKPIDFEELGAELARMVEEVNKKRRRETEDSTIVESRTKYVLRQIGNGLLGTDRDRIGTIVERNHLLFSVDSQWYMVYVSGEVSKALEEGRSMEQLVPEFLNAFQSALGQETYIITDLGTKHIYFTCFVPKHSFDESELLKSCEQATTESVEKGLCAPLSIVSDSSDLCETALILSELKEMSRKNRLKKGSVIHYRNVQKSEGEIYSVVDEKEVIFTIRSCNREQFTKTVQKALDKIIHGKEDVDGMMLLMSQDLMRAFQSCLTDNQIPLRTLTADMDICNLEVRATRSPEDMLRFAEACYEKVFGMLQELADDTDIISNAKKYIQENFRMDIDRDSIAAMAYITPNYLSKRFRAEMGMNLREYINQMRIEEAKRLLLNTNDSISKIASHVGYANISYFSTVFRKLTGMSPVDWRSQLTGESAENV